MRYWRAAATMRLRLRGVMLASGAAVAIARAHAHFDEHERRAVSRDEIDLAQAGAVVARHDGQTVAGEELFRPFLGFASRRLRRRGVGDGESLRRPQRDHAAAIDLGRGRGRARSGRLRG